MEPRRQIHYWETFPGSPSAFSYRKPVIEGTDKPLMRFGLEFILAAYIGAFAMSGHAFDLTGLAGLGAVVVFGSAHTLVARALARALAHAHARENLGGAIVPARPPRTERLVIAALRLCFFAGMAAAGVVALDAQPSPWEAALTGVGGAGFAYMVFSALFAFLRRDSEDLDALPAVEQYDAATVSLIGKVEHYLYIPLFIATSFVVPGWLLHGQGWDVWHAAIGSVAIVAAAGAIWTFVRRVDRTALEGRGVRR